jgi:hypothetical protein
MLGIYDPFILQLAKVTEPRCRHNRIPATSPVVDPDGSLCLPLTTTSQAIAGSGQLDLSFILPKKKKKKR